MSGVNFKPPRLKAGSALWLAINQMKREFRMRNNNSGARAIIGRLFFIGIVLLAMGGGGQALKVFYSGHFNLDYGFYFLAGKKLLGLFTGLLFMSLMSGFLYFSDRADLDLLLSSPLKPQEIAQGRLLVSTFRTFMLFFMFGMMFIGYTAITIRPELFSFILVAMGMALFEGGIGFYCARFLLHKFGLLTGRRISQILGFGGIAGGMLYMQSSRIGHHGANAAEMFAYHGNHSLADNILVWLGHALLGNWLNALIVMLLGLGVFLGIMQIVGKSYGEDAAQIAGQSELSQDNKRQSEKIVFSRRPNHILLRKEILSIARDPLIIAQMAIPLVAFIPVFALLYGKDEVNLQVARYVFAPMTVFVTASMTSTLAWMVASVEEARDLLQSSATNMAKIYLFKAIAALIPAAIEVLLLSALLVRLGPNSMAIILFFTLLANLAMILVEFANIKPAKRPKMMQKPDRAITSIIFAMFLLILWAVAAGAAMYNFWLGLAIVLVALIVNWFGIAGEREGQENQVKSIWQKQLDSSRI